MTHLSRNRGSLRASDQFWTCSKLLQQLLATCKSIRAALEPSTKYKSKLRIIPIRIREKKDVTRSLSEFGTIQEFSLHCYQKDTSGRVASV